MIYKNSIFPRCNVFLFPLFGSLHIWWYEIEQDTWFQMSELVDSRVQKFNQTYMSVHSSALSGQQSAVNLDYLSVSFFVRGSRTLLFHYFRCLIIQWTINCILGQQPQAGVFTAAVFPCFLSMPLCTWPWVRGMLRLYLLSPKSPGQTKLHFFIRTRYRCS